MSSLGPEPGRGETRLAYLALAFAGFYLPIETWASWPEFWHPFYVDAAIGLALLVRRARVLAR